MNSQSLRFIQWIHSAELCFIIHCWLHNVWWAINISFCTHTFPQFYNRLLTVLGLYRLWCMRIWFELATNEWCFFPVWLCTMVIMVYHTNLSARSDAVQYLTLILVWLVVPDTDSRVTCCTDTDCCVNCKKTAFDKVCAAARLPHWHSYICTS